ncbi:MAG: 30S ribosomal protein S5 [Planctomycetota bacterium]|nr:MAG: 30S ribosomal protein S5 [Planctomycetota bacterium]
MANGEGTSTPSTGGGAGGSGSAGATGGAGAGPGGGGGRGGPGGPGGGRGGPGGGPGGGKGGKGGGPGGRGRSRNSDKDKELQVHAPGLYDEAVVKVNRCAKVMKGGRRFSFSALVVVGDRHGSIGIGFGKAKEVPAAVEKAVKDAHKNLVQVDLKHGTIEHAVLGRFGAAKVKLIPAAPGTGIIAGATVRSVLELAGVRDILTKSMGSNNPINLVKASLNGLLSVRSRKTVEALRGVTIS